MKIIIKTAADFLEAKGLKWSRFSSVIAGAAVLIMMLITVADAVGRRFFNAAVYGSYESVSFLLVIAIFFSIAYCGVRKAHFSIDIVTCRLRPNFRSIITIVLNFISVLVSWLLGWRLIVYALEQKSANATGLEFTFLPIYPFILLAALCMLILGWIYFVQTICFLAELTSNGEGS